jgi:hypothetical protein
MVSFDTKEESMGRDRRSGLGLAACATVALAMTACKAKVPAEYGDLQGVVSESAGDVEVNADQSMTVTYKHRAGADALFPKYESALLAAGWKESHKVGPTWIYFEKGGRTMVVNAADSGDVTHVSVSPK